MLQQQAVSAYLKGSRAISKRDVLPPDVWELAVLPSMRAAGLSMHRMQAGLGHHYHAPTLHRSNLSRETALHLATVISSEALAYLATSDVYWDQLTSIEPDGDAAVYDLTVDELQNFTAGNIICHNSIEQDSDIVIFIYRDEVYNEDTEKKNIADIHVAKHRNGPTGHFALFFNKAQAHFVDLDVTAAPPGRP
jgi:replicative DNA helicase